MSEPYTIRPLGSQDRDQWGALWRAYLTFYKTERSDALFDLTFSRYTDPDRTDMHAWMAWDGDVALGLVHSISHAHGWQKDDVTYLQDLFTIPEARGKGVARALIQTVYDDADADNRGTVYWMTNMGNATARALYDRIAKPTDFMKYSRA